MDASVLEDQVSRILRSQTFARKSQLKKLLQVLFANINSQDKLHPDLVIRELWPNETRTKRPTDVATEINRLRRALKAYYEVEGEHDMIVICLPNRASTAGNGVHEIPWIAARDRSETANATGNDGPLEFQEGPFKANSRGALTKVAVGVGLLAILGMAAYVSNRALAVPDQPRLGRLDASALVVMNAQGKELWRKIFPGGFGPDWYYGPGRPTPLWFGDLEGKGHTSVLFSYAPAGPLSHSSTLICYSDRGREKWRWTPGRELPELAGSPSTFLTLSLTFLKATTTRPPRIVVANQLSPWWPTQLAMLDSNGQTISEYWHSGTLYSVIKTDLDGDGREEIVATGVANGYDHRATLVVLDPDRISGASTEVRPEFQIHGMGVAQERLRLLFPRSDLNRALFQFNQANDPIIDHGSLRLVVWECTTPFPVTCPIWYEFDKDFHLIAAFAGGDEFRSAHNRFFQAGNEPHSLSADEQAAFKQIRCLVGCRSEFVPIGKLIP